MGSERARKLSLALAVLTASLAVVSGAYLAGRILGWNVLFGPELQVPRAVPIGDVAPRSVSTVTVPVTNVGPRPLVLSSVLTGCTACIEIVDFPRQPIASGESAGIKLRVTARGKADPGDDYTERQVVIESNDWRSGPTLLRVRWRVSATVATTQYSGGLD